MENLLTIGEVAERSGLASSAIRFYERKGLIHAERTPSGQRRFRRDILRRIAFIRIAQRVGLTLEEIVTALAVLPADHAPTRQRLAASHRRLAGPDLAARRPARGVAGGTVELHRLRLSLASHLCAGQPR